MTHENAPCTFCQGLTALANRPGDAVWEFAESVVFLGTWQYYEGYCIAVSRHHVRELYELEGRVRHAYVDEIALLGKALDRVFKPRKLNVEMLGNQVPHLHCHIFPRYEQDPEHLVPAWVAIVRADQDEAERRRLEAASTSREGLRQRIRAELTKLTT
jgi:diadenosine tetraphosphate (Ap4A) HIT family hydrolase